MAQAWSDINAVNQRMRPPARSRSRLLSTLFVGCLAISACGQTLQDYFTNRVTVSTAQGKLTGDNSGASVEPGEPAPAGEAGGHSLWLRWVAPTNGVATFETSASLFDTLLGVYRFSSTNDTALDQLLPVTWSDDAVGLEFESSVSFGAVAGQSYEIVVDGFYGATGFVELGWSFNPIPGPPPVFVSIPPDQAVNIGDNVTLTAVLTNLGNAKLKWAFNGVEIDAATTTNLSIPNFQATNVGRYELKLILQKDSYTLPPTELQINTEGANSALARPKLLETSASRLVGEDGSHAAAGLAGIRKALFAAAGVGVVRGYNGSQVFNTVFSPTDTNAPPHCGVIGGAPYWLMYQPPANGTLSLDTVGSSYDTVMEIYTFNGALTGYQDLISLDCSDNAPGLDTASRVHAPVDTSRQYVLVVDGVNGARGTAWLNYSLNTNQPPQPPTLLAPPVTNYVAAGGSVTLAPALAGAAPMSFVWRKDARPFPSTKSASLVLTNVPLSSSGSYILGATNDLGGLEVTVPLRVVVPTQPTISLTPQTLQLGFPTTSGQLYTVMQAAAISGPWTTCSELIIGTGQFFSTNFPPIGTGFFRILIQ